VREHRSSEQRRLTLAQEAARIMAEQGVRDFHVAKRKAAERLGFGNERDLPSNREIDLALREYQHLFQGDSQPKLVRKLRNEALQAMRFFAAFEPRLVGAVLDGTADEFSAVCLHLHDDDPANVLRHLAEHDIPFDETERVLRYSREEVREFPCLTFEADDVPFDLTLLPLDLLRRLPTSRTGNGPMQRASINSLRDLIDADQAND
jgi:hypothetical protein